MFWRKKPQDPQQQTRQAVEDLRRDIADEVRQLAGDPTPNSQGARMRKQMIRTKERQLKALEMSLAAQETCTLQKRMETMKPPSFSLGPAAIRDCVQSMARHTQSQARVREQTAMLQAMGELAEEEEEALGWDEEEEDEEEEQEEESAQAMLERYKEYCTPLEGEKKRQ